MGPGVLKMPEPITEPMNRRRRSRRRSVRTSSGMFAALERTQTEGIITGDWERSMGIWRKVERRGHETKEEDKECKKCSPAAKRVERSRIVNGRDAKKTHAEKEQPPNVPTSPETK